MQAVDILDQRVRELTASGFKEFESDLLRKKALYDRASKLDKGRDKARREFLQSTGVNVAKLDSGWTKDARLQAKERQGFLDEFRPAMVARPDTARTEAKEAAVRSAVLAEGGHLVLPPFASSIFVGDAGAIANAPPGDSGTGAINSGWVFPQNAADIRLKTSSQNDIACLLAVAGPADPTFSVNFAFVPATTATYSMTAIFAFHGFYILRSDDSWWNCRHAETKLSVQMNVNQYANLGWNNFPALIDRNESNDEEVTTYDRTQFFDYTPVVLKAGDPVVVTVKGTLHAFARGSGAYAELNFQDGTANYIRPLFLSVLQV